MNAVQVFQSRLHEIVRTGNPVGLEDLITDPFVLHTPRFLRPVTDRGHCLAILKGILYLVPDIRYDRAWETDGSIAMEFKGHVRDTEILVHGLDIFTVGADGRATELTVFLRPTKAIAALGELEDAMVRQATSGQKVSS